MWLCQFQANEITKSGFQWDFVQLLLCSHHVTFFKYDFTLQKQLPFLSKPHLCSDAHFLVILILFCQTQHVCKTLSDNTHIIKLITEGRLNIVVAFFPSYSWKYAPIILVSHSGPYQTIFNVSGKADAGCWGCWIRHYSAVLLTFARFSKPFLLTLSWGVGLFISLVPCLREMSLARDPSPSHLGPGTILTAAQFFKYESLQSHSMPSAAAMLLPTVFHPVIDDIWTIWAKS